MESKADAFGVHLLRSVKKSKQLKKFRLIFLTDTDPVVLDLNLQELLTQFLIVQDGIHQSLILKREVMNTLHQLACDLY